MIRLRLSRLLPKHVGLAAVSVVVAVASVTGCTDAAQPSASASESPSTSTHQGTLKVAAGSRALFFGDSWSLGSGVSAHAAFPYATSRILHWKPVVDAVGGTGYAHAIAPGTSPFPVRARHLEKRKYGVVVVEGGLNDQTSDLNTYTATVVRTIRILQRRFPHTPIVMLGPETPKFPESVVLPRIDAMQEAAAHRTHAFYVSPLQQHWFTRSNIHRYVDPATGHPSATGHTYLGKRLAAALKRLKVPSGS